MSHHPSARDLVAAATNKKLSHQAQAVLAAFRNEPGDPEIVSVNPPVQASADALAPAAFDSELANLHLSLWRDLAPEIARIAAPGARLASGFLDSQQHEADELLTTNGWRSTHRKSAKAGSPSLRSGPTGAAQTNATRDQYNHQSHESYLFFCRACRFCRARCDAVGANQARPASAVCQHHRADTRKPEPQRLAHVQPHL